MTTSGKKYGRRPRSKPVLLAALVALTILARRLQRARPRKGVTSTLPEASVQTLLSRGPDAVALSLVMPVYNEGETLPLILKRLGAVNFPFAWELVVVDDGSTDGGVDRIQTEWLPTAARVVVAQAHRNQGKGAALRCGFGLANGQVLGVQDADLEYNPEEIPQLVAPILKGETEVVFGSREFGAHSAYSFWYVMGNRFMSFLASAIFNRYITDAYTCYKFFTRNRYLQLNLQSDGFEIEAELVGSLLKSGARVMELPITYAARTRDEGKKIKARDGLVGLMTLLKIRLSIR